MSQFHSPLPLAPVSAPAGFTVHTKDFFSKDGGVQEAVFLIPDAVAEQLEFEAEEQARLAIEERLRLEQERDARLRRAREQLDADPPDAPDPASSAVAFPAAKVVRPVALSGGGSRTPPPPTIPSTCPSRPRRTVAIYDWSAATARFRDLESHPSSGDKDVVKRDLRHFSKAMALGPWRSVSTPRAWKTQLPGLAAEMPNFAPVVTFIAQRLALADLCGTPLQPPPILLTGSPGVGKTHFTERLASAMRTVVHRQPFDNAQSNAVLRGTERHWGNTCTGALWNLIVLGSHANPVILLDELDKPGGHAGESHRAVDALLTLLEPVTSSRVTDVSIDFEFNCSYTWFIATANDANRISPAVRSRFVEFEIEAPDVDARLVLANSIYKKTLEQLVPSKRVRAQFKYPSNLQICRLAWLTPREIRKATADILGSAVMANRWHIEDSDLDNALRRVMAPPATTKPSKGGKDGDDPDVFGVVILRSPS
jgi:ATP-dependent Lon protease